MLKKRIAKKLEKIIPSGLKPLKLKDVLRGVMQVKPPAKVKGKK